MQNCRLLSAFTVIAAVAAMNHANYVHFDIVINFPALLGETGPHFILRFPWERSENESRILNEIVTGFTGSERSRQRKESELIAIDARGETKR